MLLSAPPNLNCNKCISKMWNYTFRSHIYTETEIQNTQKSLCCTFP